MPEKRQFNPKCHVMTFDEYQLRKKELLEKAEKAVYTGNPKHKKYPGDFGLTPPADPRPLASLCDNAKIFKKVEAEKLLKEAFRLGLVDKRAKPGDWPGCVWMVHNDMVLQAMRDNITGSYHGYPVRDSEPIRKEVLKAWEMRRKIL